MRLIQWVGMCGGLGYGKRQLTLGTSSRDDELTTQGKQGYLSHHPTQEPFLAAPTPSNLSQPGSLRKVKDSFGVSSPEVCGRLSLQLQRDRSLRHAGSSVQLSGFSLVVACGFSLL